MSAVAPLAGSVDRNDPSGVEHQWQRRSLPSRGAWIEMLIVSLAEGIAQVAPLAGSVDRNLHFSRPDKGPLVAPLAGSVDRNNGIKNRTVLWSSVAPLAGSVDRNTPNSPHLTK